MARPREGELQRRGTAEGPTLPAFQLSVARDDNFRWYVSWTFHYLQLKTVQLWMTARRADRELCFLGKIFKQL